MRAPDGGRLTRQICAWLQMDSCVRCLAIHLLKLIQDERLAALIAASADTVSERQDVDSVPLIDDLRFHISQLHPTLSGRPPMCKAMLTIVPMPMLPPWNF